MASELPNPSLIPFLVSVTGHRDLRPQDVAYLRQEVSVLFAGMRKRMPHTPILLLTGLAEGADQLVAEVALEHKVVLVAAIPMPIDIYKEQMGVEARSNFDALLALSAIRCMLPLEDRTREGLRESETVRAESYESLARFLARYGQTLIALWDGKNSEKRGGTSNIVHYVRSGALDESGGETELLCGVVYHVVTPRLSTSTPVPEIKTIQLGCERRRSTIGSDKTSIGRDSAELHRFDLVEINFERFNHDAQKFLDHQGAARSRLIRDESIPLSRFQKRLESLYEQADRISLQANGRRKLVLAAILITAILGALCYGIHGEMFGNRLWLWFSFPFFVSIALLLHRTARAQHVEENYLDTRALAEALRVQFFWTMSGISEPVDKYYMVDRRAELDWIRIALKNVWLLNQDEDLTIPHHAHFQCVVDNWVVDQERWYRMKADRQSRSVHRRETVSKMALQLAVLWSVLVPIGITLVARWHVLEPLKDLISRQQVKSDWVYQTFHVALAVPALLAGAYRLWIEQAGYEEQSRDYRSMQREFALKAIDLKKHMETTEIVQSLLLSLGIEALKENGRWLLLHRERPLEVLSSP